MCLTRLNCFAVNAPRMLYSLFGSAAGEMLNETAAPCRPVSSSRTVRRVVFFGGGGGVGGGGEV